MMFWNGGHWVFWQAALMWFVMIAFWGLVIWAPYGLLTGATRGWTRHWGDPGSSDARSVLDERLARGEIGPDEYERLRDLLEGRRATRVGQGVSGPPSASP